MALVLCCVLHKEWFGVDFGLLVGRVKLELMLGSFGTKGLCRVHAGQTLPHDMVFPSPGYTTYIHFNTLQCLWHGFF